MKLVPAWFPGAGWKRTGERWAKALADFRRIPWEASKKILVSSIFLSSLKTSDLEFIYLFSCVQSASHAPLSFVSLAVPDMQSKGLLDEKEESVLTDIAGVSFQAGVETVRTFQLSFVLQ